MASPATAFDSTPTSDTGQVTDAAHSTDYDGLGAILDSIVALPAIQDLLREIGAPRQRVGRKGYAPVVLFRAYLAKYIISERYTTRFIERLKVSPTLCEICGLTGRIPSESTFSRFFSRVVQEPARLESGHRMLVEELREFFPDLGKRVAIDSTDIQAWSNPRRSEPSDPDAAWGVRTAKSQSTNAKDNKDTEYFYGFKAHALCDSIYGVPLGYILMSANHNDSPQLPLVLDKAHRIYDWLEPKHLLADRGYDSEKNHAVCMERGIIPIIHIRRPGSNALKKGRFQGIYDVDGRPSCPDTESTPMEYVRTEHAKDGTYHLYRCNPEGCALKAKSSGAMLYCDTRELLREKVVPGNYRLVGPVARSSEEWGVLYAEHPVIERMFGSMKTSRNLNQHQYRGQNKVEAHANFAVLTYLGTMLGRARAGEFDRVRHMRVKLG